MRALLRTAITALLLIAVVACAPLTAGRPLSELALRIDDLAPEGGWLLLTDRPRPIEELAARVADPDAHMAQLRHRGFAGSWYRQFRSNALVPQVEVYLTRYGSPEHARAAFQELRDEYRSVRATGGRSITDITRDVGTEGRVAFFRVDGASGGLELSLIYALFTVGPVNAVVIVADMTADLDLGFALEVAGRQAWRLR